MKTITFVVVVYNNYPDTADCVASIAHMTGSDSARCVIVDNSDQPEVQQHIDSLATLYAGVEVLRPPKNLGYFGAFNFYFERSYRANTDCVILCNNDLVFSPSFLEKLSTGSYAEDVFVVCPDVVTLDGVHQNPHVISRRTAVQRLKLDLYFAHYYVAWLLRFGQKVMRTVLRETPRLQPAPADYLHMGIGACYVLLPSFLTRYQHLEFPHFLYGEEAYLARQVHNGGGRLFYDPALTVLHKESATLSKLPKRLTYEFGRSGYWSYRDFY